MGVTFGCVKQKGLSLNPSEEKKTTDSKFPQSLPFDKEKYTKKILNAQAKITNRTQGTQFNTPVCEGIYLGQSWVVVPNFCFTDKSNQTLLPLDHIKQSLAISLGIDSFNLPYQIQTWDRHPQFEISLLKMEGPMNPRTLPPSSLWQAALQSKTPLDQLNLWRLGVTLPGKPIEPNTLVDSLSYKNTESGELKDWSEEGCFAGRALWEHNEPELNWKGIIVPTQPSWDSVSPICPRQALGVLAVFQIANWLDQKTKDKQLESAPEEKNNGESIPKGEKQSPGTKLVEDIESGPIDNVARDAAGHKIAPKNPCLEKRWGFPDKPCAKSNSN
jgi:hypothetical protein